jgi:hypothetical protein
VPYLVPKPQGTGRDAIRACLLSILIYLLLTSILPDPPRCRNDPACVCTNDAFIESASSCVQQSCSDSDAQMAVNYWTTVCGGYGPSSGTGNHSPSTIDPSFYEQLVTGSTPTVTPSSNAPPSSSRGSVSSSSGTKSSSSRYGYPTVTSSQPTTSTSITSSNPYPYGGSSSATNSPVGSSNPYPYGGSSASGSGSSNSASRSGSSSRPSSSASSNLAATIPTHAAALIAGGIGAMVAVFV